MNNPLENQRQTPGGLPPATMTGTVLVIDDDPRALQILTRFLTREGFRVATAASGEEALRLAQAFRPSAITLDINVPGSNGLDVLAALKADSELSSIPVDDMVTATDDRNKGHALGVTDYLLKPVKSAQLGAILQKYRGLPFPDPCSSSRTTLRIVNFSSGCSAKRAAV